METNESNLKPQPTGGLKLMTVFIAVLALHVVVIGGFTVWHLLYPSGTDADLTLDKSHKAKIVTDGAISDLPGDSADKAVTSATPAGSTTDSAVAAASTTDGSGTSPAGTTDTTGSQEPPATPTMTTAATPATPAVPATSPAGMQPVMTEDASSTAANPPATPAVAATPAAATTPDQLAPPAEVSTRVTTPEPATPVATTDAEAPATTPIDGTSYSVKRGDSLARIAHRHHISLDELRSANNLKSDRLRIAQVLMIPSHQAKTADADAVATTTTPAASTATTDSTTATTAAAPAIPATRLVASTTPHHEHKLAAAESTHHSYTVVKGDTLTKIAKRYHTTTSALVAANGLANAGRLSIGQKLHIPAHEARGAATAAQKPIDAEPHGAVRAQLANYVQ